MSRQRTLRRADSAIGSATGLADSVSKRHVKVPGPFTIARNSAYFAGSDEDAAKLAAPEKLDRHQLTDAFLGQQSMQIVDATNRLARKLHDHIARPQLRCGGGAAF